MALTVGRRVSTHASRFIYKILLYKPPPVVQVVLSTAHPAKFSEEVTKALSTWEGFEFERDVLPQELRGLLEKERRVMDVDEPDEELVKREIESKVESACNGV